MWFQTEAAISYQRLQQWGEALKKAHEVDRVLYSILILLFNVVRIFEKLMRPVQRSSWSDITKKNLGRKKKHSKKLIFIIVD